MSFPKLLRIATLAGLIAWAAISLGRFIQESFSQAGSNDYYTHWHAGYFVEGNCLPLSNPSGCKKSIDMPGMGFKPMPVLVRAG